MTLADDDFSGYTVFTHIALDSYNTIMHFFYSIQKKIIVVYILYPNSINDRAKQCMCTEETLIQVTINNKII